MGRWRVIATWLASMAWMASFSSPASAAEPAKWRGLRLAAGDGELRVGGLVQADGVWLVDDTAGQVDRFEVRRARVRLDARLGERVGVRFQPQFTPGGVVVLDGFVDVRLAGDALSLRMGKQKTGLGIEMLQVVTALLLPERGLSTALVPVRDVGLALRGRAGVFEYQLGVMNGAPDGSNRDGDVGDGFDLDARVAVRPVPALGDVGFALAGGFGAEEGTADDTALARYRTVTRAPVASFGEGAVADGIRWRVNPQAWAYVGPFGALGEFVRSSQGVRGAMGTRAVTNDAWLVGASWVLTGEDAAYGGVTPAGALGAVEVAARYGELRFDAGAIAAGMLAGPAVARSWGVALNVVPHGAARVQLAVEQTRFEAVSGPAPAPESAVFLRFQAAP